MVRVVSKKLLRPARVSNGASALPKTTQKNHIMKLHHITELTLCVFAAGTLCLSAIAQEEKEETVSIDKIPAPAAAALKKAAAGAEIKSVEMDNEDGKMKGYEAAFTVKGHRREVSVTADGKVYAIEDEISLSDAPAAAKAAIEKQANGSKVAKVEHIQENGKVTYEAVIGSTEYEFAEDGKLLGKEGGKGEEKKGKEDKD